jgi:hypothetical protein
MFILVFGLVVLIACWVVGDQQFSTKVILTLLYVASFALLLSPDSSFLFIAAQCLLIIIIGGATFGTDWLRRNMR